MKHHSSFKIHSLKETNQEAGLLCHFGWDQKHLDLNVSEEGGRHNSEERHVRKGRASILENGFPGLIITLHLKTDIQAWRSCIEAIPEARLRSDYFKTNNNLNLKSLCHFS